jgi:hypothetical protein
MRPGHPGYLLVAFPHKPDEARGTNARVTAELCQVGLYQVVISCPGRVHGVGEPHLRMERQVRVVAVARVIVGVVQAVLVVLVLVNV